jgi:drug/metabolite transporter (DMT)-like permease
MALAATATPVLHHRSNSQRLSRAARAADVSAAAAVRSPRVRAPRCVRLEAAAAARSGTYNASASSASVLLKRRLRRAAPKSSLSSCRVSAQDDEGSASSSSVDRTADESLECVVVGMEAACVVGENESGGDAAEGGGDKAMVEASSSEEGDASSGVMGLLGGLALVSPFFLWGTSMVAMKEVLPATSPLFVASVRLVPAGAVLIAWAASKGRPWPKGGEAWLAICIFGLVDGTMFQGCLSEGLQRTSAGLGSVIIDSQPLTVAILASIIYGETLAPAGVFGLFLGVVGLLLLELPRESLAELANGDVQQALAAVTAGVSNEGGLWDSGEWWMLLAAQSMAVGTVMVRWVCKYVDPIMATGWHMALGGLPLLAYSVSTEPEVYRNLGNLGGYEVGGLLYTSLLGSALAYGAFFYFASKGSLTKLSSLTFLTPMFAAFFGYLLLDETLDEVQLAGALVTVVGIYLVNTRASEGPSSAE